MQILLEIYFKNKGKLTFVRNFHFFLINLKLSTSWKHLDILFLAFRVIVQSILLKQFLWYRISDQLAIKNVFFDNQLQQKS